MICGENIFTPKIYFGMFVVDVDSIIIHEGINIDLLVENSAENEFSFLFVIFLIKLKFLIFFHPR